MGGSTPVRSAGGRSGRLELEGSTCAECSPEGGCAAGGIRDGERALVRGAGLGSVEMRPARSSITSAFAGEIRFRDAPRGVVRGSRAFFGQSSTTVVRRFRKAEVTGSN